MDNIIATISPLVKYKKYAVNCIVFTLSMRFYDKSVEQQNNSIIIFNESDYPL